MAGQTIQVSVLADTRKFSSAMRDLGNQTGFSRLARGARAAGRAVAVAGVAAAGAAVAFGTKAVGAASDLEQSIGGVDAVFKDNADTIHQWARTAANEVGLSRNSYNELSTIIGTTLKNSGTSMDELAGKTNDMIGIAADLSATFGGSVTNSANAMASALRGEFEPLRQYGISLSQAAINARAMADSGKASADALTQQEKAAATQALILEQSADAQGAFARESDTLAGTTERLKAKFDNVTATLGTYLLPVITAVVGWLSDNLEPAFESLTTWVQEQAIPAFQTLAGWFQENVLPALQQLGTLLTGTVIPALAQAATWVQQNSAWLAPLAVAIGTMVVAYQSYVRVLAIYRAATTAARAAQIALNAAMAANPIGLVVLAITGLVAAIVYLWNTNEDFRNAVTRIWNGIKSFFTTAVETIRRTVTEGFSRLVGGARDALAGLGDFISGLPGRILGWLGDLGSLLWDAGQSVIQGFLDGIESAIGWVQDRLNDLTDLLPDWKGPAERDRRLLYENGQLVIEGFERGVASRFGNVRRLFGSLTDMVAGTDVPALAVPGAEAAPSLAGSRAANARPNVNVTVQTLNPDREVGRVVNESLEQYYRSNGRGR